MGGGTRRIIVKDGVGIMPTYEYECAACGAFELFQSIKDQPLKRCPKCKGKVKRLIGRGAGILFKGSGFYQTDYRSEGYKKGAKADKGEAAPATKKDEAKPAAPATTPTATPAAAPAKTGSAAKE